MLIETDSRTEPDTDEPVREEQPRDRADDTRPPADEPRPSFLDALMLALGGIHT